MGCGGSKLEEVDAVALCRRRSELLADAMRHRYAFADAHAAHAVSLRAFGAALHRLLNSGYEANLPESGILPLPAQRKGDPLTVPSPPPPLPAASAIPLPCSHSHSRSQSGSHIHFHSSNDSESDIDSPFHSDDDDSPVHRLPNDHEFLSGGTFLNLQYARNNPPAPAVSFFQQRVGSPEQVHYASSSSSYPYAYQYPGQSTVSSGYPFPYSYQPSPYGYNGMDGFFGSSSPPTFISQNPQDGQGPRSKASTSRTSPPPPSPPRTSTWDFLNPFESFKSYYPPNTPSRSSKELRDIEGIPDLEDDEQEVVKEAYGDQKFGASTSATDAPEYSGGGASVTKDVSGSPVGSSHYHPLTKEVADNVIEKNMVGGAVQKPLEERKSVVVSCRYHGVSQVTSEITFQFDRAIESTNELSGMLEVGKQPYNRKNSVYAVSSRIMCVIPVSMSKGEEDLDYVEEKVMSTGNLSSTLQKLYIWEQKLYDEVRVEEKMRLLHDRSIKKLQYLDSRGAEAQKIEVTQAFIRKLSTKIRIVIQVVNSISTKISLLRDEELRPQIIEIIKGLERMWRAMLECHQIQSQAISESKYLDSIASGGRRLSDEHINALMQLELELLRWIGNFSSWINAQKNFVKSLNGWLLLCLHNEPEVTVDGIPPYSPGSIDAPLIFTILNNWSQALDRVSMAEVLNALQYSAASLKQLWRENDVELRQKSITVREVERLNNQFFISSGKNDFPMNQIQHAEPIRLQSALQQVFRAMENFAANSMNAYEDLNARSAHEKTATMENANGSQVL